MLLRLRDLCLLSKSSCLNKYSFFNLKKFSLREGYIALFKQARYIGLFPCLRQGNKPVIHQPDKGYIPKQVLLRMYRLISEERTAPHLLALVLKLSLLLLKLLRQN